MEKIDVIFENYGGQQIGRIFKKYFSLTLFFKQLIFSFYIMSADPPVYNLLPEEINQKIINKVEAESLDQELNWIQVFQLMLIIAELEEKTNAPEEDLNQK